MFKKLDKDHSGTVDKIELIHEFSQNPDLGKLFGFNEKADNPLYLETFHKIFDYIGVGNKNEISMIEFLRFFENFTSSRKLSEKTEKIPKKVEKKETSPVRSPRKILKKSSSSARSLHTEKESPVCLLSNKHMGKLEEIFESLDTQQDFVVKRGDLVDSMFENSEVIKILHIEAVKVSYFQTLDLESMLYYIKNDGNGEEEMIT